MKQIEITKLEKGDIFAKEMALRNRKAFQVKDIPKGKEYILIKELYVQTKIEGDKDTKLFKTTCPYVLLLKRPK